MDHINNELEIYKQEEIEVKENENIEDLQKIKEQQEKDYKDIQLRIGANLNILKENEKNVIIFPGPCTHRPSHHPSRVYPKPVA